MTSCRMPGSRPTAGRSRTCPTRTRRSATGTPWWSSAPERTGLIRPRTTCGSRRRGAAALDQYASGAYVNFVNDEGAEGVLRAYSPEKLARLTAVKTAYDPDNVFHLNHNIKPVRR